MRGVDGVHDLGGKHGYGAVEVEADEPVFHHDWERVARALTYAAVARMPNANTSAFRHVIERMEPGHYLTSSYYERWLTAAATIAVESGLVTHEELERRAGGRFRLSQPPLIDEVQSLSRGQALPGRRPGAGAGLAPPRAHQVPRLHPREGRRGDAL